MSERKGKYLELETELKRCRLCGNRPTINHTWNRVQCDHHKGFSIIVVSNDIENAIAAWNKLND